MCITVQSIKTIYRLLSRCYSAAWFAADAKKILNRSVGSRDLLQHQQQKQSRLFVLKAEVRACFHFVSADSS